MPLATPIELSMRADTIVRDSIEEVKIAYIIGVFGVRIVGFIYYFE